MMSSVPPESVFFGPLIPDWTIADLLQWIGTDDARCHDERLVPLLDAAERALGARPLALGRAVARVRLLASQVAADPTLGERRPGAGVEREAMVGVDRVFIPA